MLTDSATEAANIWDKRGDVGTGASFFTPSYAKKKEAPKKNKNNSKISYNVLKKQPNSLGFFYYSKWTNTISRKLYTLLKLFWHSQSIKNVQALILWLYVAIIIYYNDENLTVQNQELQIQHHEIIQYNLHFWRIQVYFELLS